MADLLWLAFTLAVVGGSYVLINRAVRRAEGIPPRHEQIVRDALAADVHDVFEEDR